LLIVNCKFINPSLLLLLSIVASHSSTPCSLFNYRESSDVKCELNFSHDWRITSHEKDDKRAEPWTERRKGRWSKMWKKT